MKSNTTLLITVTGLFSFILGWFLHGTNRPSSQTKETQVLNTYIDTVSQKDTIKNNNFSRTISGHFVIAESNCAGFNFINHELVLWTNEIACFDPDTLKIRWLNDSTFMTRSTLRINEGCPPIVNIYKVISFDGNLLNLKSIWTGWNDAVDKNLDLFKQPN